MWVCLSTSNISPLTQTILVHTITGNVVGMWNVCMAFWKVDWNRICLEDAINTQFMFKCYIPSFRCRGVPSLQKKTSFKETSQTQRERKSKMGCTTCLHPCGFQSLWKLPWSFKCKYFKYMHKICGPN